MKWSGRQIKALKASINHWKRLASGKRREGEVAGAEHCSLCLAYSDAECRSCPVAIFTGDILCINTPYRRAAAIAYDRRGLISDRALDSDEFKAAAVKELVFLKKVLRTGS